MADGCAERSAMANMRSRDLTASMKIWICIGEVRRLLLIANG